MSSKQSQISAVPLLLLSGLLCDEEIWADVMPRLDSFCAPMPLCFPHFSSIESMADHVLAHAPKNFALAGHSMGGRVALEVARRAPSRVLGIALLNTGVHPTRSHEPVSRGRLVNIAREQGITALAQEWLPPMLFAQTTDSSLRGRLQKMVERNTAESFAAQIQALLNRPEAESVLAGLSVPTLLLSADGDTWSPPEQHAAMHALCPRATLVIVKDAGHMSPAEQPEAVSSALNDWMHQVRDAVPSKSAAHSEALYSQWDDLQDLADIPGTTIFTGTMARLGFELNQFCMSLIDSDNRKQFKKDELNYLKQWALTPAQETAVLSRDYLALLSHGGNVYFLAKLGATDGLPFLDVAASMSGLSPTEYREMMIRGGRLPEGLRSLRKHP